MDKTKKQFPLDILDGLRTEPKRLSSKYFYDETGDKLYSEITQLEEYYLSSCETEILSTQGKAIVDAFGFANDGFDIIELGARDGTKVVYLLKELENHGDVRFVPIDISENALSTLNKHVNEELPWLQVSPLNAEYFEAIKSIGGDRPRVVLFLGSNIGNFDDSEAQAFMSSLSNILNEGDKVLLGVDLMKRPEIVLPAYNDSKGITKKFNLNLLTRINSELGGNFDLSKFEHKPRYDEITGVAESFLRSTEAQTVKLESLGEIIEFLEGEEMQTERSIKYDGRRLTFILQECLLSVSAVFQDSRDYFADVLLTKTTPE